MTHRPDDILERKTALAKAVLFLEAAWSAIFPAVMVCGLALLVTLLGLFSIVPRAVHIGLIIAFALALVWSLRPVLSLRWPSDDEALRHLETTAGVPHRPASSYWDTLNQPDATPVQRALWQAHKARLAEEIGKLRPGLPRSRVSSSDPYALRVALALSLLATIILVGDDWRGQVRQAVAVGHTTAVAMVGFDTWITPPRYTGRPPIFLAGSGKNQTMRQGVISVPAGSELVVRFNNADRPAIVMSAADAGRDAAKTTLDVPATGPGTFELRKKLTQSARLAAQDASGTLGEWEIQVVPDKAPVAEITGGPGMLPGGIMAFDYSASDDYGLTRIQVHFDLSDIQGGKEGLDAPGLMMVDPPSFDIDLRGGKPRQVRAREQRDLTAHPWAGANVDMWLEARDEAGQMTKSEVVSFVLPEKPFRHPLAQALVEQRRVLLHDPDQQHKVARVLDALMTYPDGLISRSGLYLNIRAVYQQLLRAEDRDQLQAVTDMLWEIALAVEEGDLSQAQRDLLSLQRQLQQALAENAPPERIQELMRQLREAIDRYLQALMEQARKNRADGPMPPPGANMQMVTPQDLSRMMDLIEDLAKSGANEAAQRLLSELNNILNGLMPDTGMAGQPSPMGQALQQLGDLMGRQQQLMDQTHRMQPGQGGQQPGQGMPGDLSGRQQGLGETLQQMLDQMGRMGIESPEALERAREAMRRAAEALRNGQRDEALGAQNEAIDQMRQGAEQLAQQMQEGQNQAGNMGPMQRGRPGRDVDPLGRPGPTEGEQFGDRRNVVPDELTVMRAQEVLRILRERLNDSNRPALELDYFERLLRGIY